MVHTAKQNNGAHFQKLDNTKFSCPINSFIPQHHFILYMFEI